MNKKEMREYYKDIRRNILEKKHRDQEIFKLLLTNKFIGKSSLILTYVSLEDEVDTLEFINEMLRTKKVAVPKIVENEMKFYIIRSLKDLREGIFKVMEPTTNEEVVDFNNSVCIVPGICFDQYNNRLGYGKGYYDRFLANYQGYTIGICYDECFISKVVTDAHDVQLQKIIHK